MRRPVPRVEGAGCFFPQSQEPKRPPPRLSTPGVVPGSRLALVRWMDVRRATEFPPLSRDRGVDETQHNNMVDRNLLREFDVSDDEMGDLLVSPEGVDEFDRFLSAGQVFDIGGIVSGKVIEIVGDQVIVDVGYKSEGARPAQRVGRWRRTAQARRRRGSPPGRDGGRDRRDRHVAQESPPAPAVGDGDLEVSRR